MRHEPSLRGPHDAIGRDAGRYDAPSRPSSSPIEPYLGANQDPSLLPPEGPPQAEQRQAASARTPSASIGRLRPARRARRWRSAAAARRHFRRGDTVMVMVTCS